MATFFLFIIACAVAPEAIVNIARFITWVFRVVGTLICLCISVWFFGWCIYTIWDKIA